MRWAGSTATSPGRELQALLTEAGMTPTDATEGAGKGLAGTVDPFILMTSRRDA